MIFAEFKVKTLNGTKAAYDVKPKVRENKQGKRIVVDFLSFKLEDVKDVKLSLDRKSIFVNLVDSPKSEMDRDEVKAFVESFDMADYL